MSKFTKGPWYLSMHGGEHSQGIYSEARARDIALVYNDCDKDEDRANANLLVAAPDLLEALEEFLDYEGLTEPDMAEMRITFAKAHRAIRKAKEGDR